MSNNWGDYIHNGNAVMRNCIKELVLNRNINHQNKWGHEHTVSHNRTQALLVGLAQLGFCQGPLAGKQIDSVSFLKACNTSKNPED